MGIHCKGLAIGIVQLGSIAPSTSQIIQKLGCGLDGRYAQMVTGSCAGDVEQVAFGVMDFLQVRVVAYRFDSLLQGNDLVVAGHPTWGSPRIAQQITLAFGIPIDKDIVRRILASHYRPEQGSAGPSWLTFIGHLKDSLWSIDLFRCESATLRTHWILVVMDQYTRRIIGFGVQAGMVDGVALCGMFNHAIRGHWATPQYLSSDHDPLYRFDQWQANLRILDVAEIKTVPYIPLSHPFVERLIGTIRREYLDRTLFWTTVDLENKLLKFRDYFNSHRTHQSLAGRTPDQGTKKPRLVENLSSYRWQSHCRGLYQTSIAA